MRLFVSIDLPPTLADPIADIQDDLAAASGLRFTDPEQAHVTLKFLGGVDAARLPTVEAAIERAVADAAVEPFEATVEGIGVFPSLEYISVVWVGIAAGAAQMTRLHETLEAETTAIGFEPASHDFSPHVTIARMDHAGGKDHVQEYVETASPRVGSMHVEEVRLTESTLTDTGPVYETVGRYPLEA